MPPFVSRGLGVAAGMLEKNCFCFCFLWLEVRADLSAFGAAGLLGSLLPLLDLADGSSADFALGDWSSFSLALESPANVPLLDSPFSTLGVASSLLANSVFCAGGAGARRVACCIST